MTVFTVAAHNSGRVVEFLSALVPIATEFNGWTVERTSTTTFRIADVVYHHTNAVVIPCGVGIGSRAFIRQNRS